MTPLVAFTGPAGAGKTTAAQTLVKHFGFHRLSFAQPLRDMLVALGVPTENLTEKKHEPIDWLGGKSARHALQLLGTEWGRQMIDQDLWLNVMRKRIESVRGIITTQGIVIDDCRFDNEARLIHELKGSVFCINRPGCARMEHESERGISPELIDQYVPNNGNDWAPFQGVVLALFNERYAA